MILKIGGRACVSQPTQKTQVLKELAVNLQDRYLNTPKFDDICFLLLLLV